MYVFISTSCPDFSLVPSTVPAAPYPPPLLQALYVAWVAGVGLNSATLESNKRGFAPRSTMDPAQESDCGSKAFPGTPDALAPRPTTAQLQQNRIGDHDIVRISLSSSPLDGNLCPDKKLPC